MTASGAKGVRHLVTVWDPSRDVDAMQAHLRILLDQRRAEREHRASDDDVFVWWGKIRSPNRQQPMPHLAEILALDELLKGAEGPDAEVHLYLTDYRSLYVGHVGEITADDVREDEDAATYVPRMYDGVSCDCWFRLMDVRRLVHDDTLGVIAELRKLRNTHYHDRAVSIYGGMVDLPLIVRRDDGARWFDPEVRRRYVEGRSWAEFDAEQAGLGAVERDLRENMIGEEAWQRLDPAARTFVATAEKVFRDHRGDAAFDFSPVLVNFAKAVEVQANDLLRRGLQGAPSALRHVNVEGETVDVTVGGPFSLGQLARIITDSRELGLELRKRLVAGEWFVASLPPILEALAEVRNPAAHRDVVRREEAMRWRNQLVGVACVGTLVELGRVRVVR